MLELNYPVLKLTPTFVRGSISSPKNLLVVGELNFERGCFNDACIIDSSGYKYRVISAKKGKWTWDPWNIFKRYRSIWVSLVLSEPEKHNVDILREELFNFLVAHPDWYVHSVETEESLRSMLFAASTVEELINSISVYP